MQFRNTLVAFFGLAAIASVPVVRGLTTTFTNWSPSGPVALNSVNVNTAAATSTHVPYLLNLTATEEITGGTVDLIVTRSGNGAPPKLLSFPLCDLFVQRFSISCPIAKGTQKVLAVPMPKAAGTTITTEIKVTNGNATIFHASLFV